MCWPSTEQQQAVEGIQRTASPCCIVKPETIGLTSPPFDVHIPLALYQQTWPFGAIMVRADHDNRLVSELRL
jgi:hypothetical protein